MTKRGSGGFGNFKGADLLRKLKAALTGGQESSKSPPSKVSIEDGPRSAAPNAGLQSRDASRPAKQNQNQTTTPSEPARIKAPVRNAFGEAEFKKLEPYRRALDGFVARHRSSATVSPNDQELAERRILAGAEAAQRIVDRDDGYFLGYDFGTSTTKVIARYAYGGVDEAFAIEVPPSICSDGQAHLWPTTLWFNRETGHLSLLPEQGALLLDSFKSALLQGQSHRICRGSGLTMREAAVAFVALHLAYALGAALDEEPAFRLASVNVGIPVAVLAGQANVKLFEHVVEAATCLVNRAATLTLSAVKQALADARPPALPYTPHAELSGAIAGYCAAPRFYMGGHMIIDCGSATLDMATFDLDQRSNRPLGIYAALVETLGADACLTFCQNGITIEECQRAVRYEEYLVFRETVRRQPVMFSQDHGKYPYQIILIGGGVHSEVHAPFFEKLASAFARPFHHPSIADTLRYDTNCEAGRLVLADGLARDPIDLKDVAMPMVPLPAQGLGPQYIGPEQV